MNLIVLSDTCRPKSLNHTLLQTVEQRVCASTVDAYLSFSVFYQLCVEVLTKTIFPHFV